MRSVSEAELGHENFRLYNFIVRYFIGTVSYVNIFSQLDLQLFYPLLLKLIDTSFLKREQEHFKMFKTMYEKACLEYRNSPEHNLDLLWGNLKFSRCITTLLT